MVLIECFESNGVSICSPLQRELCPASRACLPKCAAQEKTPSSGSLEWDAYRFCWSPLPVVGHRVCLSVSQHKGDKREVVSKIINIVILHRSAHPLTWLHFLLIWPRARSHFNESCVVPWESKLSPDKRRGNGDDNYMVLWSRWFMKDGDQVVTRITIIRWHGWHVSSWWSDGGKVHHRMVARFTIEW